MIFCYCTKHQLVIPVCFDGYTRKWVSLELLSICDCSWKLCPEVVK